MKKFLWQSLIYLSLATISKSFHGNELQQYYRYLRLTSFVNSTYLFGLYDECEKNTIPERGFRYYLCRYHIRDKVSFLT
jgi:hypothetical protein